MHLVNRFISSGGKREISDNYMKKIYTESFLQMQTYDIRIQYQISPSNRY